MMKCKQAINLKDKIINKQNAEFRVKHFLIFDLDFPYSLLLYWNFCRFPHLLFMLRLLRIWHLQLKLCLDGLDCISASNLKGILSENIP